MSGSEESFYHLASLPRSITAAKALLKSNVFLNVRDYLEQRNKGLDALRKVMHPSRRALVKDLSRGKGQRKRDGVDYCKMVESGKEGY